MLIKRCKKVIFVENYPDALTILKKNLSNISPIQNFEIIEKNIYDDETFLKFKIKFDVIFLDPPFKDKNLDKLLIKIENEKLLNKNGIIIIHRHKSEKDLIPERLKIIEEKKYGISKIIFLTF